MRLFMYGALLGCIIFTQFTFMGVNPFSPQTKLVEVFSLTVFYDRSLQSQYKAAQIMLRSEQFLWTFIWVPTIVISICLCVDLSMLVLYPFSPHKKRMWWYGFLALLLSVMSAVLSMEEITTDMKDRKFYPIFISAECVVLGAAAVFSSIVAGIRLH
jgi:hypothetical protein